MIKTLKYIGFIASGVISYMLMITLCESIFDYILAFAMTLVLQASSFYFFDKAIKEKDSFKKYLSSALAIMLFLISIIGTISFQFGIQNNAKNEMIVNSDAYLSAQKSQERKEKMLIAKANELELIKNNLDQQLLTIDNSIADYKKLEKAQNTLYTTKISNLNKQKNLLRAEFATTVQKANQDLAELTEKANEKIDITNNVELKSTKGYLPLLETFANWFDWNLDILTLIFQSFLACIFELTAICLHIEDTSNSISKKFKTLLPADFEGVKPNPTTVTLNPTTVKPNPIVASRETLLPADFEGVKPNPIGFKLKEEESKTITEADIDKYIKFMENPNSKGLCRGYKKISELTGFKQEDCRTIKGILERRGIVQTTGTKTKIIK